MVQTHISTFKYWIKNVDEEAWWRNVSGFIQIPKAWVRSKTYIFQ